MPAGARHGGFGKYILIDHDGAAELANDVDSNTIIQSLVLINILCFACPFSRKKKRKENMEIGMFFKF